MVETVGALAVVEEIAAVDGVDGIFVGPTDLAISLGVTPGTTPPVLVEAAERIVAACETAGIVPGIYGGEPERARFWADHGFRGDQRHHRYRAGEPGGRGRPAHVRRTLAAHHGRRRALEFGHPYLLIFRLGLYSVSGTPSSVNSAKARRASSSAASCSRRLLRSSASAARATASS